MVTANDIIAGLKSLESQATDLGSYVSGLEGKVSSLTADNSQLQVDLNAANEKIKELEAGKKASVLFGVNASSAAQHDANDKLFNPVNVWRYYRQPGERPLPPTEYQRKEGQSLVISTKIKPQDIVGGKYDNDFTTLFKWMTPADYFCMWHEPEDDVEHGNFTVAQYKAGWAKIAELARAANPKVKLTPILMSYTWNSSSKRKLENFLPDNPADWDVLGIDIYFAGNIGGGVSGIPSAFDNAIKTASQYNKPWGVAETGVGTKVSGQDRLNALTNLAKTLNQKGPEFVCYFNNAEWKLDANTVKAFNAGRS